MTSKPERPASSETTGLRSLGNVLSKDDGLPRSEIGSRPPVNVEAATKRLLQEHRRANEQKAEVCLARDCAMSFDTVKWGRDNTPLEMKLKRPPHGLTPKWDEGLGILEILNAPSPERLTNMLLMELAAKTAQPKQADESAEMRMEVYRRELTQFPADVVKASLEELGRECRFFPTWQEVYDRLMENSAWRRAALRCVRKAAEEHA